MNLLSKFAASAVMTMTLLVNAAAGSEFAGLDTVVKRLYSNGQGSCSVVFVTPESALTAAHCVTSNTTSLDVREGEVVYPVSFFLKDPSRDIATLFFREGSPFFGSLEAFPVIPIATYEEVQTLSFGQEVISLGYPGSRFRENDVLFILDGRFMAKRKSLVDDFLAYSTSVPVGSGMSGGGMFAKFDDVWKLIGINIERDPYNLAPEGVATPLYE